MATHRRDHIGVALRPIRRLLRSSMIVSRPRTLRVPRILRRSLHTRRHRHLQFPGTHSLHLRSRDTDHRLEWHRRSSAPITVTARLEAEVATEACRRFHTLEFPLVLWATRDTR